MKEQSRYITPEDLKAAGGVMALQIKGVAREIIDGRPRLVMYFQNTDKALILTRQLAETISEAYGRDRMVDDFFASPEGAEH